jgi:hypothetical protein
MMANPHRIALGPDGSLYVAAAVKARVKASARNSVLIAANSDLPRWTDSAPLNDPASLLHHKQQVKLPTRSTAPGNSAGRG